MLPRSVLYYGREEPLPKKMPLRAGPLSMVFDQGDLRYIRLGGREILRRIYVAVRDRNWGTVPGVISNLSVSAAPNRFRIVYESRHTQGEVDFHWKADIAGEPSGDIRFRMEGKALTPFLRNRIGFCVHHPIKECAGQPCTVEKVDGTVERGFFPKYISPHQPFLDMRAISHEALPGLTAEVRMEGDAFEMEDHRNWTDANYKTYSTPLRLPYPVEVRAGAVIAQSVRLSLRGKAPEQAAGAGGETVVFTTGSDVRAPLPSIGLGLASHAEPLSAKETARLKAMNLSHVRLDLVLSEPDWAAKLDRGARQANVIGVPLEAAVTLSDSAANELDALAARLRQLKPRVRRWLVFHARERSTRARWVTLARERLAPYDERAEFVSGTNVYFTELNRERPDVSVLDAACFSINPQVHAFDNDSLVENLDAQGSVVESARQFLGGKPVVVSPIVLKPRFNPVATGPEPPPPAGELPPQVDPRQMSLFGAGWTAGSLKYIAESGCSSVTYYETTGWRGVMETEKGPALPARFRSMPGAVFPLYHVLADAGEFVGGEVLGSRSSHPLAADGIVMRKQGRVRILLANLGPDIRPVRIGAAGLGHHVRWKQLDERNAEEAMREPERFRADAGRVLEITGQWIEFDLPPYGLLRIDAERAARQERAGQTMPGFLIARALSRR